MKECKHCAFYQQQPDNKQDCWRDAFSSGNIYDCSRERKATSKHYCGEEGRFFFPFRKNVLAGIVKGVK